LAFLKDFRRAVGVLKKQGLIDDVDARSAYPTWKRGGKKLSSIVEKFDPIVTGKATAVSVPEKVLRKYRAIDSGKSGREYIPSKGIVIEPHGIDETAYYDPKKEAIVIKHRSGIERIQLPIPFHNLEQWARDVRKNRKQIDALKDRDQAFGFRYFGNNGSEFFSDIGLFIDFISQYSSFADAIEHSRRGANVYKNIEILRLNRTAMQGWVTPSERHHQQSREYQRKKQRKFRQRLKKKPQWKQQEYVDAATERMRLYRARMTKVERKEYNAKAKRRMRRKRNGRKRK
jgi:hypothetical protein